MEAALSSEEFRVRQALPAARSRSLGGNRYEADFSSPEALRDLHAAIAGNDGAMVGAVINFLPLCEPFAHPGCNGDAAPLRLAQWVFNVLKEFQDDLRTSAQRGGGWALNFTSLGGRFGLVGNAPLPVAQAATLGMFKTIRRERPELWVKTIDLDPHMDPQMVFAHVAEEMTCDDGMVEVGIADSVRWRIDLVEEPPVPKGALNLDEEAVVLVTGGACGVTADVAKALAREARPRLVLVGRSPLPQPEPAETRDLAEPAALRKYLIGQMRRQKPQIVPAEIERAMQRMLKDRQILSNIAAMQQAGSAVEYHALDVRDRQPFAALIDDLYQRYGRIDGVVHGAGVIEDSLIASKTPESFARVFSTKVDGALVLANKLRGESLKFFVMFSSVSGRFGNAGQIDYAAANDCLNKLAAHLDGQWPGRVVAINWGPWDAGMVSDELRRLYASKGVHLIPREEGARLFLEELKQSAKGQSEVVLACNVRAIADAGK